MKLGISTSSLYPMNTEQAVAQLTGHHVRCIEIFFNSFSELEPAFVSGLRQQLADSDTEVLSIHPFTSGIEPMLFFSEYSRRLEDGIAFYRRYFSAAQQLGAKLFVLHGDHKASTFPDTLYFERFLLLSSVAKEYGITLAQENVARCRSGYLDFLQRMKEALGNDAAFVCDLKQARRAGIDPLEMIQTLGSAIRHIHLSDGSPGRTCCKIGDCNTDFQAIFSKLKSQNYQGGALIELYRSDYGELEELFDGYRMLCSLCEQK
jgi:sugar phosphate isomerase/epimerase